MKIERYTDEQLRKNYKYWKTIFIMSIFFLVLSAAAILMSEPVVSFIILLATIPLVIVCLFSSQEANYNTLLLEIRRQEK